MKNASKVLASVLAADLSSANVQLCLASTVPDEQPFFQRVNITKSVAEHFRKVVRDWLGKLKSNNDQSELVLRAYDPQAKLDNHELEFIALQKHDEINKQIRSLRDPSSLDVFKQEEEFIDSLRFYAVIAIRSNSSPIIFFRFYTPKKELGRSKLFGIMMKNGQFDYFKDSLFLFDERFDCFVCDDVLYISNKDAFQKIFKYYEMLIKTAKSILETIKEHIPIQNFDEFSKACEGHLQKVAKLKNISTKPYISKLTINDLKMVITKYELPIKTIGTGLEEKLLFETSDKWAILKLLDDDFLESIMTGDSYEVNSKRLL